VHNLLNHVSRLSSETTATECGAVISKKGVKSMEQVSFDKDYLRDLPADNGG
jgi:hypothetical protein